MRRHRPLSGAINRYTGSKGSPLFAPIRFLWNATRGSRLTPWRSEYFRWRVETYSGRWAEQLKFRDILGFLWSSKGELLRYLAWTGRVQREAQRKP